MDDNAMVFWFLSEQFPNEHITNCIDAQVVSTSYTSREDPEDPVKMLHTVVYALKCPHCPKFDITMLLTSMEAPE